MTHLCVILPFPERRAEQARMRRLNEAEEQLDRIVEEFCIERENMGQARAMSRQGGLRNGRAVLRTAKLLLTLIILCGEPSRFAALAAALRHTLQASQHPTT